MVGAMSREKLLFSFFNPAGRGLEIGPSFNPLVPKTAGYHVEIVDHLTAEELREKYSNAPNVDLSKIEEVDYVSDGGSIFQLIGKPCFYDYIVALHVIEHTPDMVGFLCDCEQLLKDDGVVVLAIPDRRYTFDYFRPYTTTGQIVQAHVEKRQAHSPGQIFDEIAYNCLYDGKLAWEEGSRGTRSFFRALSDAKELLDQSLSLGGGRHDIHAWQFTPSSFRLIINDLFEIGVIPLKEQAFIETVGHEFFISLSKSGAGCPLSRLQLAERTVSENS